ncbi:helix-turn-helix domain-containing protein [Sphaerisporangium sp. TRM90804]|uniref:helix-turn-helix domain-containing protein n=1 Tax=Sphaerisporangium sp. TRM90804 TaxID=3031113 RepID=UPI0024489667|nr:helix-turn-helix domain-containing protein [Sphaerisporangium sp. TRM90804]MDH2430724.1 helix-turn-helix domain-containing protein [Sphaerisporangium sp. TRM90804]
MAAKRTEHVHREVREVLRLAAARLLQRLPELTEELVTRVREGDEAYRRLVSPDDHWQSTQDGLRIGIEAILQKPEERRDLAFARQMASRRAEQGLPLESLMRMYRLSAQVTWAGFVDLVEREHPERLGALVRTATHVWHAIDRQALTAAETYRRREKELLGRSNERVNALLDELLEGAADGAAARSAAAALDLPERGRYAVVTIRLPLRHEHEAHRHGGHDGHASCGPGYASGSAPADAASPASPASPSATADAQGAHVPAQAGERASAPQLRAAVPAQGMAAVSAQGMDAAGHGVDAHPEAVGAMRVLWRMRTQHEVAVVALGDGTLDELVAGMKPVVYGPAGVSPVVEGLGELATARRLAELAMRTCSGCGPEIARLDRRLPSALVISQPELSGHLVSGVLGALLSLDPADRDVLLATLSAWLRCEGSAARAAGQLYCHRNTVFNRMRRVEQLTGRSLSRPRDIVELALALEAARLLPPG